MQIHVPSAALGGALFMLLAMQLDVDGRRIPTLTAEQAEILSHLSLVHLDDGQGGTNATVRLAGVNFQIVNGLGGTESVNGVGNLIVGYNELGGSGDERTGSHCVVVGSELDYSSYGGQVLGRENEIASAYASVFGGRMSSAVGPFSVVAGGAFSYVQGDAASVFGGHNNFASGPWSTVTGGHINSAQGSESTIAGGWLNRADGTFASVSGGRANDASGYCASVGGGRDNLAGGDYSTVGGGSANEALHLDATVGGGCSVSTSADCGFPH